MAVLVEHDKRKHEILEKALELFIEEGYEDVTFQKIADRCNITRTTLYIYFKNKREIFIWSIKQLTGGLEQKLREIIGNETLSARECLTQVLFQVISDCEANTQLFKVLLVYIIQLQKSGVDVNKRVSRRLIRLHHLMNAIIIRGQASGEFRKVPIKDAVSLLYSQLEDAIFNLAVLGTKDLQKVKGTVGFAIDCICIQKER
ncbi:MAG TPA: TetR/AcrR family transcriptional regulator [Treponema sp.]|nr:TetR/AcrR family transcriptional regulator [Treponema sp.]